MSGKRLGMTRNVRLAAGYDDRPQPADKPGTGKQSDGLKKRGETSRRGTLRAWRAEDPAP